MILTTAIFAGAAIGFGALAGGAMLIAATKFGDAALLRARGHYAERTALAELLSAEASEIEYRLYGEGAFDYDDDLDDDDDDGEGGGGDDAEPPVQPAAIVPAVPKSTVH